MPYDVVKRGDQWCVVGPTRTHGCHDTRADAIKQQRALYKNAPEAAESDEFLEEMVEHMTQSIHEPGSSEATVTMTRVEKLPVKDVALLRMALKRSEVAAEQEVEQAISIAAGLADPEVAAQTVAVIGHLADRLRTAELNQAALVDVLQAVAADSTTSRNALLEALSSISERLAEAPQVNVTVPVPDVNVTVETPARSKDIEIERDPMGRIIGYRVEDVETEETAT